MPYPAFLLRQEAAAVRQLMIIGALQVGQADEQHAAIPIAMLRDTAGI